ncbi:MAG: carbohydrate binding family 9 domain-containing protein [Flavobacteriales bacterium]|nr:carbohydrate binding family 9 domain-containing protein [Flavobacteriales bacterium]
MRIFCILTVVFSSLMSFCQKQKPSINIQKAKGIIELDGVLNEQDWQNAEIAAEFYQQFPYDTSYSKTKTEVKITYDDNFIYVGAICFDELEGDFVIQSLKRDFSYPISDAFAIFLDPFGDQTNGFSFAVNPLGVQREGLLQGGGNRGVTTSWDNKWFSKVTLKNGKWIVEMAIPFKTIRYSAGALVWGINFSRNDLKQNENSSWAAVPRNFNIATMAFTGDLIWDTPPKKAGLNVSIIPYGIVGYSADYENDTANSKLNAGLDAKIAITSSLNLDITINPDFSQVEVDAQQTNLTRFSLFYPEKRQFFIENSDLFGQFGFSKIRPFFSRRIGLNSGQAVPIIGGLRLSGKVNENWRVGLMNMQTAKKTFVTDGDTLLVEPENYTVAAVQRKIFKRSNIGAIFVNKQIFNTENINASNFNRIIGLDYNLASANNKWLGKIFYHHSLYPNQQNYSGANASWLMYNTQKWNIHWNHEYVGRNYNAAVGFVQRYNRTYWRLEPSIEYKIYPKSGPINNHSPNLYFNLYADSAFVPTDMLIMPHYKIKFQNTSVLEIHYHELLTRLLYDTDVTFSSNIPIPKGTYHYRNAMIKYKSDARKAINGKAKIIYGSYYIGNKFTLSGGLGFRKQPWGILSFNFSFDDIRMPEPYQNATILLIGPKLELSFTKTLFWSTFVQYNSQAENFNVNSRLQWRFRPMSDLYIVYTDNYYTLTTTEYDPYFTRLSPQFDGKRDRAIVIKFVYWLSN